MVMIAHPCRVGSATRVVLDLLALQQECRRSVSDDVAGGVDAIQHGRGGVRVFVADPSAVMKYEARGFRMGVCPIGAYNVVV